MQVGTENFSKKLLVLQVLLRNLRISSTTTVAEEISDKEHTPKLIAQWRVWAQCDTSKGGM
jgi:hypothetical protein